MENAYCHISINEWETASRTKNYLFYLWIIGSKNLLAIIDCKKIAPFIPTNNLSGEWESVKIPFNCFSELFQPIEEREEKNE